MLEAPRPRILPDSRGTAELREDRNRFESERYVLNNADIRYGLSSARSNSFLRSSAITGASVWPATDTENGEGTAVDGESGRSDDDDGRRNDLEKRGAIYSRTVKAATARQQEEARIGQVEPG
ncbi:hypothetical protein FI667_g7918, partial [Globisporangium splendens]